MLDPSPFAAPGSAAECRDCLLFALGREEYALDMSQVEAICGHLEVRPQAGAATRAGRARSSWCVSTAGAPA